MIKNEIRVITGTGSINTYYRREDCGHVAPDFIRLLKYHHGGHRGHGELCSARFHLAHNGLRYRDLENRATVREEFSSGVKIHCTTENTEVAENFAARDFISRTMICVTAIWKIALWFGDGFYPAVKSVKPSPQRHRGHGELCSA